MRPEDGPDASTAAVAEGGLQVTSPAHWSRTGQLCGRISAALLHPSACGGCAASVRGHPLPPVTHPISVKGRTHRALSIRNTAASCCALLTRAGPDHGLVGLVPHCSGEARAAAEKHVVCDRCYTPRTPRIAYARMREGPIGPCSGGCGDPGGPTHCTPGRRPTPRDPPGRRRAAEHASTVRI